MPSALHILKPDAAPHALAVIERQSREPHITVTVVLLHGTPVPTLPPRVTVYRLDEQRAQGVLSYSGLLDLIFSADQVVSW